MVSNLAYLGIYPDTIDVAIGVAEAAVKCCFSGNIGNIGTVEKLHEMAKQDLEENGSMEDITNSIIHAYFSTAAYLINEKFPYLPVDYYVNCTDSHFYIDGCRIYANEDYVLPCC